MTSSNVFLWPCFPETLPPRLGQASRMLQRIVDQEPLRLGGGEQRGIGGHKTRERHVVLLRLAVDQQGARQMDRVIGAQGIPLHQDPGMGYESGGDGEQVVGVLPTSLREFRLSIGPRSPRRPLGVDDGSKHSGA